MLVCQFGDFTPSRGALDEAFFDEEGFVDLLHSSCILANSCGYGAESDGTSLELVDDGGEEFVVYLVQSEAVDVESFECHVGYGEVDGSISLDLCEVSDTSQEGIGYTRCSS